MYKVLIADDESKVIQLIKTLIQWETLNLELIGIASDGIQALEMIEKYQPDIVITDIRMPGYDGIELIRRAKVIQPDVDFIIISGYQHFDYAHNAIKYDVKDYLLKPLKKGEINSTLQKMVNTYNHEQSRNHETDLMLKRLKKDKTILQKEFVSRLFNNFDVVSRKITLNQLNNEYQFKFNREYFRLLAFKPDIPYKETDKELLTMLMEKTLFITQQKLVEGISDKLIFKGQDQIYVLLNYDEEDRRLVRNAVLSVVDEVTALRDLFKYVHVTVALSSEVRQISEIYDLKNQVDRRVMNKLLSSTKRVIEIDHKGAKNPEAYFDEQKKAIFVQYIRELDIEGYSKYFDDWAMTLSLSKDIDGPGYVFLCESIVDLTMATLKRFDLLDEASNNLRFSKVEYRMERTIKGVFDYTLNYLRAVLGQSVTLRKRRNRSPIEEAIQYIESHYSEPIGLEQVSEIVGFNPSYFSTLFKKETGKNFLEYLTALRVTHGKEWLSDHKLSVSEVAEKCGYLDVKHFSKQFKKYTGLTPAKYRKLYY